MSTGASSPTRSRLMLAALLALGLGTTGLSAQATLAGDQSAFGTFAGSSPCGELFRQALRIPSDAACDLVQWELTLRRDAKTQAPSHYELRGEYGSVAEGKPGLAGGGKTLERRGAWTIGKGSRSDPDAIVYELDGIVSLVQVDANILHVLNPDLSLMVGTSGWSYTLNRKEHSEKPVHRMLALFQPDMSYLITPIATGPTVFGVFEGRSPCHGIAHELKIPAPAACTKSKWRVTLFQDPETLAPTTYKVEGSLHRSGAREGNWTLIRGTPEDTDAIVYRLAPTGTEAALLLLKGDDNVLFFLGQNRSPLVGHRDFSYTLNG